MTSIIGLENKWILSGKGWIWFVNGRIWNGKGRILLGKAIYYEKNNAFCKTSK